LEYQNALRDLGEEPPAKWGLTELKVRLLELEQELGVSSQKRQITPLQQMTRALNKASTKKANLQQFCEELGMSNVSNSTITQLQKSAMDRIYMQSKADVSDPVGFGTHSAMSYGEIAQSQVEYCQWVVATAQEGQCSHRLTRLANWLEQNPDQMGNSTNKQGNKYKTEPKVKAAPRAASSQGSVGSNDTAVLLGAMTKIMTQMENMQEEMDELRGRAHKKSKDEESEMQSSWSAVNGEPK
jgi:hypothetical protein